MGWGGGIPEIPPSGQVSAEHCLLLAGDRSTDWGLGRRKGQQPRSAQADRQGWCPHRAEHLMWPHLCAPPSLDQKTHRGSEGPDGGHRLPGNALKSFILSLDPTMRTFQTLTQGKKSLFFPGQGPWCQAEARGWERQGRRPRGWRQRRQ